MPNSQYAVANIDLANIEPSLLEVAKTLSTVHSARFLEFEAGLCTKLSAEMRRSCHLLSMAKKGEDDASQTEKVATQALLEYVNTMKAMQEAEQALKDLAPVLAGSNDELFERVVSGEDWYLRCDIFGKLLTISTPCRSVKGT